MNEKRDTLPILPSDATLIDTHCHLDMADYRHDLDKVLAGASQRGISRIITVGIDYESSLQAVELAVSHDNLFATVGIHPHNTDRVEEKDYTILARLCENPRHKIVAYGEIGLDYAKKYSTVEQQQHHFRHQLYLAKELQLPVIIHDRDAHEDTLRILQQAAPFPAGGVIHCFSGDMEYAQRVLDLGFHISVPGIVTFKNAGILQEVASRVPSDKLLLETDGPFLAPIPFRGKRNLPEYLLATAAKVAELREQPLELIAKTTTLNACNLFSLEAVVTHDL